MIAMRIWFRVYRAIWSLCGCIGISEIYMYNVLTFDVAVQGVPFLIVLQSTSLINKASVMRLS